MTNPQRNFDPQVQVHCVHCGELFMRSETNTRKTICSPVCFVKRQQLLNARRRVMGKSHKESIPKPPNYVAPAPIKEEAVVFPDRKCVVCEKPILSIKRNRKTCGAPECQVQYNRISVNRLAARIRAGEHISNPVGSLMECLHCQAPFTKTHGRHIYCSYKCSSEVAGEKKKKYQKKYKRRMQARRAAAQETPLTPVPPVRTPKKLSFMEKLRILFS